MSAESPHTLRTLRTQKNARISFSSFPRPPRSGSRTADCGVKGTAGTKALCEMLAFHYGEEFLESSTSSHPPGCSKYSGGGSTWIVWSDWSNSPVTTAGSASHEDVCLCGTDATWNSDSTTCTCPLTDKSFLTTDSRCVYDNCDTARKAECTADNKEDCSPGKNTVANVGVVLS